MRVPGWVTTVWHASCLPSEQDNCLEGRAVFPDQQTIFFFRQIGCRNFLRQTLLHYLLVYWLVFQGKNFLEHIVKSCWHRWPQFSGLILNLSGCRWSHFSTLTPCSPGPFFSLSWGSGEAESAVCVRYGDPVSTFQCGDFSLCEHQVFLFFSLDDYSHDHLIGRQCNNGT